MSGTEQAGGRGFRGWVRDITMGVRFAFAGGAEGWLRTVLTTVGIGLAVGVLLFAAAVPSMLANRNERNASRDLGWQTADSVPAGDDTVLFEPIDTDFRGESVHGFVVQPEGPDAPVPPGLDAYPKPGQMVVSPALAEVLESDDGDLLRPRMDYEVVGVIGEEGLGGPADMLYFAGTSDLDPNGVNSLRTDSIGQPYVSSELDPALLLLLLVGVTILLLPIVIFVAVAVRFGGERRDRRLAAMRLVGADRAMARRMAAGESLVGSVTGLVLGAALFLAARPVVEHLDVFDMSAFTSDLVPNPIIAGLIVVGVPLLSLLVTLFAMRRLSIEPLGVVRNAVGAKRRLWWRLILPVVGLLMLAPFAISGDFTGNGPEVPLTVGGIIVLLVGMSLLVPWVVEAMVRRVNGGSVPFQLAVRRIQVSGGSMARMVNGIAVTVAGGLALTTVFAGVQSGFEFKSNVDENHPVVMPTSEGPVSQSEADSIVTELGAVDGVETVIDLREVTLQAGDYPGNLLIGDCEQLSAVADIPDCADGDAFTAVASDGYSDVASFNPGDTMDVMDEDFEPTGSQWTVPDRLGEAELKSRWIGGFYTGLLVTPGAAKGLDLDVVQHDLWAVTDLSVPDTEERVRNVAEPAGWFVSVDGGAAEDPKFTTISNALLAGVTALMILIGLSMLIGMLEQLQERRRLLSMLSAFGVRRRTMVGSLLWQSALTLLAGLVLALVTGTVLGGLLLRISNEGWAIDWPNIARLSGVGVGLVLLVTVASLPVLWRIMRADGIRTE